MSSRRLARNSVSSVVQALVSALIVFELYRFLASRLSISEIGIWSLVLATTAAGRLGDLGVGAGIIKFVANDLARGDRKSAAGVVGLGLATVGVLVGILCIVLYPLLSRALGHLIRDPVPLAKAITLLPISILSLWISMQGVLTLSALDGCQRTDIRALITVSGSLVQLAAAYVFVPWMGLRGIAFAQLLQSGVVLLLGVSALAIQLEQSLTSWLSMRRTRWLELMRYGAGIQLATIGQMLFDPAVKGLLAAFGGLALTGYYELANRLIMQLRSFVVVGYQSLVAYVASSAVNGTQAANIYLRAHRLLVYMALPYYTLISIYLPIILYLWLGRFEGSFLFIAQWSLLGWVANTMVAPAYFLYLALGKTTWPVISQFVIGILNVVAGCVLGAIIGGNGVIIGAALALTVGSGVVAVAFCREYKLDVRDLLPRESRHLMALCALCLVLAAIGARAVHALQLDVRCYVAIALFLTIPVGVGAWRNEQRAVSTNLLALALARTTGDSPPARGR